MQDISWVDTGLIWVSLVTPCIAIPLSHRLSCLSAVLNSHSPTCIALGGRPRRQASCAFLIFPIVFGVPFTLQGDTGDLSSSRKFQFGALHIHKFRDESPCQMMVRRCSILWPALEQLRPATERPSADIMATAGNPSNLWGGLSRDLDSFIRNWASQGYSCVLQLQGGTGSSKAS